MSHFNEGFEGIAAWLNCRIGRFFVRQCRTKPTGRIFPLPTAFPLLQQLFSETPVFCVSLLRLVCVGLNSLNGEGTFFSGRVSPYQRRILEFLRDNCMRVCSWKVSGEVANWANFWRVKAIDYRGEEVQTAQQIQWENIAPALPEEIGQVDLREVVDRGCRHYVENFSDYLLPIEEQRYTRPPRVMVPPEAWEKLAQGLVKKGVCTVLHESELYHIDGKPLLNGLFGVSKGEFDGQWETMRLIMNLIPLNNICRGIEGDVATLPCWSGMNAFQLMPHEDLVVTSEDVRCFFYIFRVPQEWCQFLAFNRAAPASLGGNLPGRYFLCSRVLPMGFKNSVSLAQHVHRLVVQRGLIRSGLSLGGESEIRKDRTFTTSDHLYRVYLDNFDELKKVNRSLAAVIEGKPSVLGLALREEYVEMGIPRHPKKGVEEQYSAEVQGAIVDGKEGVAYPKPEKTLRYCQLALCLLQRGRCTQKECQVVGGGFVYLAMFRRPLLGGLNALWRFIVSFNGFPPFIVKEIPPEVKEEMARMVCLFPLACLNFRTELTERVTASDASETGGGVCVSSGLTAFGHAASHRLVRGDLPEAVDIEGVLTIGLFDGIGALRVATDVLKWNVCGHVSVECNKEANRVVESQFPNCLMVMDITHVDKEMVHHWATKFSQVALVLIGAGPPCQGVSGLNADRKGALKDARSKLFSHVGRIRGLVKDAFPWAQVRTLMESVASMDETDCSIMSQHFGEEPWELDAACLSLARRPRLYWIDWELLPEEGVSVVIKHGRSGRRQVIEGQVQLDIQQYLAPGWKKVNPDPFPTFTTSRPRQYAGRHPAGLQDCSPHEVERWQQDAHRFPPYQYLDKHLVVSAKGAKRLPSIQEREVIMGFPVDYTRNCMKKALQDTEEHNDCRLTLVGNSWNVASVVWLLQHLGQVLGLNSPKTMQQVADMVAPGASSSLQGFLLRKPLHITKTPVTQGGERALVSRLCTLVSFKGEDLLLQPESEDLVKYHRLRASIPAALWKWKTAAAWKWSGGREHINVLEMRAVLCSLRWRLERKHNIRIKFLHMVDSQVCLHALSRGRSSSRKLRRTLLRINSLLLATGSQVVWTYVHTKQNPADAPSRRAGKRKWADV